MTDGKHPTTGAAVGSIVCLDRFFKCSLPEVVNPCEEQVLEDERVPEVWEALDFSSLIGALWVPFCYSSITSNPGVWIVQFGRLLGANADPFVCK